MRKTCSSAGKGNEEKFYRFSQVLTKEKRNKYGLSFYLYEFEICVIKISITIRCFCRQQSYQRATQYFNNNNNTTLDNNNESENSGEELTVVVADLRPVRPSRKKCVFCNKINNSRYDLYIKFSLFSILQNKINA